ncbi:MAG: hypothetical protein MUF54_25845 [Polyangiaceae bacterium]|nr:hypothetical protein [Polyangiaceae bacterium]
MASACKAGGVGGRVVLSAISLDGDCGVLGEQTHEAAFRRLLTTDKSRAEVRGRARGTELHELRRATKPARRMDPNRSRSSLSAGVEARRLDR